MAPDHETRVGIEKLRALCAAALMKPVRDIGLTGSGEFRKGADYFPPVAEPVEVSAPQAFVSPPDVAPPAAPVPPSADAGRDEATDLTSEQLRQTWAEGTPARIARSMPWRIRLRRMWRAFRGREVVVQ